VLINRVGDIDIQTNDQTFKGEDVQLLRIPAIIPTDIPSDLFVYAPEGRTKHFM